MTLYYHPDDYPMEVETYTRDIRHNYVLFITFVQFIGLSTSTVNPLHEIWITFNLNTRDLFK